MQIFISKLGGETFSLDVSENDTVVKLKDVIYKRTGIHVSKQKLGWNNQELRDGYVTLGHAGVVHNGTLNLLVSVKPSNMTVFYKNLKGQSKTIKDLNVDSTVTELKNKIHEYEGMPPDQQRLTVNGKPMSDERQTLGDYDMKDGSTVHLNGRLRGG